jgi:hypothetical protein
MMASSVTPEPPRIEAAFDWTREPEGNWLKRLRAISPPSDEVPYLHLHWLAGWPHAPIQRWVLYEVVPRAMVHPDLLAELDGPNPREVGRWVPDSRVPQHLGGKSWCSDSLVSYDQWVIGHATHGYPVLYWLIQGDRGGYRWQFSTQERRRLRMMGLPDEPPAPGDEPFLAPNEETWRLIAERDRLKHIEADWRARYRTKDSAIAVVSQQRVEAEAEFRASLDKWLRDQVSGALDSFSRSQLVEIVDQLPRGAEVSQREQDRVYQQFLSE